jgi:F-type H+-transporting ATPase subunit b
VTALLFDGFTALAQVLNFVILVFLLKRFLYGPILRAMADRKRRIAAAMDQARAMEREARDRSVLLERERQNFLEAKSRMMAEAGEDVRQWRQNALTDVRREVDVLRQSWNLRLTQDQEAFMDRIKTQVAGHVLRMSDKVLRDLADESIQQRLAQVLLDRLLQQGEAFSADDMSRDVVVQAGFPMSASQTEELHRKIRELVPGTPPISFETTPTLGMGLRMVMGDRKVEWNLSHYMKELEQGVLTELRSLDRERQ